MNAQEAAVRFREADALFNAQRYADALTILDELDRLYPNTKNIMFPRASCLEKLGRLAEADALCDALIAQFNLPRAVALKQSIASRPPDLPNYLTNLDLLDLGGPPPRRTPLPRATTDWSSVLNIGLIVAGVLVVVVLLGWATSRNHSAGHAPVAKARASSGTGHASGTAPMISFTKERGFAFYGNRLTWQGAMLLNFVLTFFLYSINLFLTLLAVNKLPHDTWSANIMHCIAMAALCAAMRLIPWIGLILNALTLRQNYEFRFVDFITLAGISMVTGIVLVGIPVFIIVVNST